jgi:hypothetical protein
MHTLPIDPPTPETIDYLTLNEVTRLCDLSHEEAAELIEFGAIQIENFDLEERYVSSSQVAALQHACKLYHDYDVDLFCVVLSLDFMRKIADLEDQLSVLTALNPRPLLR